MIRRSGYRKVSRIKTCFSFFFIRQVLPEEEGPTSKVPLLIYLFHKPVLVVNLYKKVSQYWHLALFSNQFSHMFLSFLQNSSAAVSFLSLQKYKAIIRQKKKLLVLIAGTGFEHNCRFSARYSFGVTWKARRLRLV